MVLVDANVIVRIATRTPKEQYEQVREFFQKVARGEVRVYLMSEVAMEVYFVLWKVYGMPKERILDLLERVLSFKNVACDDILKEALSILRERNIDFVDAMLCARARIFGDEIFSFDKKVIQCAKL